MGWKNPMPNFCTFLYGHEFEAIILCTYPRKVSVLYLFSHSQERTDRKKSRAPSAILHILQPIQGPPRHPPYTSPHNPDS